MKISLVRAIAEITIVVAAFYMSLVWLSTAISPYASPFGMLGGVVAALLFIGLRGERFSEFGFRPVGLRATAIIVITLIALAFAIFIVLEPHLESLFGPVDLSIFNPLEGDTSLYLWMLAASWIGAAFGEEVVYRGFIMTRIAQVFSLSMSGWIIAIFMQALIFAVMHSYQNTAGMIEVFLYAIALGVAYLAGGRSLWPVIVAHGLVDTIAMTDFYQGGVITNQFIQFR
ncbi:MAG: type II CAAX endopeptidase family protein [Pseudomonadota bacterium]